MPSVNTIRGIIKQLTEAGLLLQYDNLQVLPQVNWDLLPEGVGPRWGGLPSGRLERKRRQLETLVTIAQQLSKEGDRIVDFGSSSGHVGLPLACLLPHCSVTLLDMKPIPLDIARKRIETARLNNVKILCGNISEFTDQFDIGIGLHVCGDATDQAIDQCIANQASYVFCPCDLGEIQRSSLPYPRSKRFADVIDRTDFNRLARAGDWTSWDFEDEKCRIGWEVSGWLALDRNLFAEEHGYRTSLLKISPAEAGLKSVVLTGQYGQVR